MFLGGTANPEGGEAEAEARSAASAQASFPARRAREKEGRLKRRNGTKRNQSETDGYRSGTSPRSRCRGFSVTTRMQVHGFLKEHGVYLNYGREDLEQDPQTLQQLRKSEPARG